MVMLEQNKDFEIVKEIMAQGGLDDSDVEDDYAAEDDLSYELMLIRRSSLFKCA